MTIVLFGGLSDERHVSVATAQNVVRALGSARCWFWGPDGAVHEVEIDRLLAHERPFERDFDPKTDPGWPDLERALDEVPNAVTVLLALHGGEGEDGTVQRMLETRGVAFTGSGSAASAAAFDKERAKEMVKGRVPLAESRVVREPDARRLRAAADVLLDRYPRVVLKPLSAGSSRGLFFVDRGGDVNGIAVKIARMRIPYIIEQFVSGQELTVGVADMGAGPLSLPVLEIEVDADFFFDYEGKYLGKGTREICPAQIPDGMAKAAQHVALTAHLALGCHGYSRTDVVAAEDGIYFLELNTLPGLTTSSLVPQELRAAGIDFRQFLEKQIELAVSRRNASRSRP